MDLSAYFDYPKVIFDKDNEVVLSMDIKAPKVEHDDRQPLNLVAVLDISGSMAGEKIERMKKTVQILIDHLTEQDKLGIVIFGSNFTKLAGVEAMTSDRKAELKTRVAGLQTADCTNISGAMLLGFELLGVREKDLNRVMLLTDGLPNVGESTIPGLVGLVNQRPKGVSLSTFGFGTDHNPELLQSMAQAGSGNYYYIENADQINTAFAQELGGLVSCFAQNIKIEAKFKPGVKDVDVINKAWEWEYNEETLMVRIPDLFAEERKSILVKVVLEKRTSALPREVTIADVKTTFTNLIDQKEETVETKAKITFVKKGEESQERDKEIAKQEARLKAAEAQKQAAIMADAGDFMGARNLMGSAVCCLYSAGENDYAHEMETLSTSLEEKTYSKGVGYDLRNNAYSTSRGRSAGKVFGCTADLMNSAQRLYVRSFNDSDGAPSETPATDAPDTKKTKKGKKGKKYNPMA